MNAYSCGGLYYKSTDVAIDGGVLLITFDKKVMPRNLEEVHFLICQCIPNTSSAPIPVVLLINKSKYPLLTNTGNNVMSDQLASYISYDAIFGNNPEHFLLPKCCGLRCTRFVASAKLASSTTQGESVDEESE